MKGVEIYKNKSKSKTAAVRKLIPGWRAKTYKIDVVKHYLIKKLDNGELFIEDSRPFRTLTDLVSAYSSK